MLKCGASDASNGLDGLLLREREVAADNAVAEVVVCPVDVVGCGDDEEEFLVVCERLHDFEVLPFHRGFLFAAGTENPDSHEQQQLSRGVDAIECNDGLDGGVFNVAGEATRVEREAETCLVRRRVGHKEFVDMHGAQGRDEAVDFVLHGTRGRREARILREFFLLGCVLRGEVFKLSSKLVNFRVQALVAVNVRLHAREHGLWDLGLLQQEERDFVDVFGEVDGGPVGDGLRVLGGE